MSIDRDDAPADAENEEKVSLATDGIASVAPRRCPNCCNPEVLGWRCQVCGSVGSYYPFELIALAVLIIVASELVICMGLLVAWPVLGAASARQHAERATSEAIETVAESTRESLLSMSVVGASDSMTPVAFLLGEQEFDVQLTPPTRVEKGPVNLEDLKGRFLLTCRDLAGTHLCLLDGDEFEILAEGGIESFLHPVWSPDGTKFAFSSVKNETRNVYVASPSGGYNSVAASIPPSRHPSWSPDGHRIAYVEGYKAQIAESMGTGWELDRSLPFDKVTSLDWSRQNVLALVVNAGDGEWRLVLYGPDNSRTKEIAWKSRIVLTRWDSTGTRLAFVSNAVHGQVVYILDLLTASITAIIEADRIIDLCWSPAGDQLVLVSAGSRSGNLLLFDLEEGSVRPLLAEPVEIMAISWAP